jgi:hypothetical protein
MSVCLGVIGGILIYMFLDLVLHEDSENGIKSWKKLLLGTFSAKNRFVFPVKNL